MADFEIFYRSHVQMVYALVLSRAGDRAAAEDMTQETFLRAWQSFQVIAGLEAAAQRAWLIRTARNLTVDAWRREEIRRSSSLHTDPPAADESSPELHLDISQALTELDDEQRELVIMRYIFGMDSREIGQVAGIPPGTVRRRLAEARKLLADRLRQWAPRGGRE
jgi:RNA polymerase sigma-70 factor (ECF subfamily)